MITCNIKDIERKVGIPVEEWPGNCYAIATQIVKKVFKGKSRAVYGAYYGMVSEKSIFFHTAELIGWVRHGWILVGKEIYDPLRWEFLGEPPFMWHGRDDNHEVYDEGHNSLRESLYGNKPYPAAVLDERIIQLKLAGEGAVQVLQIITGDKEIRRGVSFAQAFWIANLPYHWFGGYAYQVYMALKKAGKGALVPYDNMIKAQEEKGSV